MFFHATQIRQIQDNQIAKFPCLGHCTVCTVLTLPFCTDTILCSEFAQILVEIPDTKPRQFAVCLAFSNTPNVFSNTVCNDTFTPLCTKSHESFAIHSISDPIEPPLFRHCCPNLCCFLSAGSSQNVNVFLPGTWHYRFQHPHPGLGYLCVSLLESEAPKASIVCPFNFVPCHHCRLHCAQFLAKNMLDFLELTSSSRGI